MIKNLRNYYDGKRVIVTGDTGFKGSWLSLWLQKLGAEVIGIGLPPLTIEDNYVVCGLSKEITHYNCDIRNPTKVHEIFLNHKPEIVFHLAAQPLVLRSYQEPHETFETNIMGTVNALEAVRKSPSVHSAVIITSDKCYENKEWIYGYRETDRVGGKDPYSASKGAAEIVTSSYIHSYFSDSESPFVASARAGNVFGGGDWCKDRIIPDCIRSFRKNETVVIRNPDAVRPWQHVLEPLYGYLLLAASLAQQGKKYSGAWNFGPMQAGLVSVENLVQQFVESCGFGSYKIQMSEEKKESHYLMLDSSKALHNLSWKSTLDLKSALLYTAEEYNISGWDHKSVYEQRLNHIDDYMKRQMVH